MQFIRHPLACYPLLAIAAGLMFSACQSGDRDPVAELTGEHTRVVWVQDISAAGNDTFAQGSSLRLMGYDSHDGKGERPILGDAGNYAKPLLTSDGNRVIFGNRQKQTCYMVNFDGSGLVTLGAGYPCDTWKDPESGTEWAIVGVQSAGGKDSNTQFKQIERVRLDKLDIRELVWNKAPVNVDNFQLSADGAHAAGLFPWPHAGRASLPNKGWDKSGQGCWTSMAPDNSQMMWVFDGAHRNLRMLPWGGQEEWKINLSAAPDINGFEVYHPRWSNHARFLVMSGPYLGDGGQPGGNRIRSGGRKVELYLGKFSSDYRQISDWVKITANEHGDFFPDVWVDTGDKSSVSQTLKNLPQPPQAKTSPASEGPHAPDALQNTPGTWPESFEGLVFFWKNNKHDNKIRQVDGTDVADCQLVAHDKAIFNQFYGGDVRGGYLESRQPEAPLLNACRQSNAFSFQAVITPADKPTNREACIISFMAKDGRECFALKQAGNLLTAYIRTSEHPDSPAAFPCGKLSAGTSHVLLSLGDGKLSAWLNGESVLAGQTVGGSLSDWEHGRLVYGCSANNQEDWQGDIDHIALYTRALNPTDAARQAELALSDMDKRHTGQHLVVEAVMKQAQPDVTPGDIGQYTRALNPAYYEITKVIEGKQDTPGIIVYHWTILDREVYPTPAKPGQTVRLELELKSAHPQLDAERVVHTFDDIEFLDMPEYIDMGERGRTPAG